GGGTMSEYWEWQQEDNGLKVRIHRRVLAGLEHEGVGELRGMLLGSASPATREVLVEDYAPLDGSDGQGIEEWLAERDRHSLPAVGYFRMDSDAGLQI